MSKLVLFGGKGGVGKTTTSSAVAVWCANEGYRTLIVSSDPAHSTRDSFGQEIGSEPTSIDAVPNLWAVEIDPGKKMEELAPKIQEEAQDPLRSAGIEGLEISADELNFPGIDEALAFDLLLRYVESHEYDIVIFDTAPTGHTLKFLSIPELMDNWMMKIYKFKTQLKNLRRVFGAKKDTSSEQIENLKRRVDHIRRLLSNPEFTSFYIVLIPELLAVEESRRAKATLGEYQIPVKGAVVNQIFPPNDDCNLCSSRVRIQTRYMNSIQKEFAGLELANVPLFEQEIQGVEALHQVANHLLKERKQLNIQPMKSMSVEQIGDEFHVRLFFPGATKKDLKLRGEDRELVIDLNGIESRVAAPFEVKPKKTRAKFEEDFLHITVGKP